MHLSSPSTLSAPMGWARLQVQQPPQPSPNIPHQLCSVPIRALIPPAALHVGMHRLLMTDPRGNRIVWPNLAPSCELRWCTLCLHYTICPPIPSKEHILPEVTIPHFYTVCTYRCSCAMIPQTSQRRRQ
mmetsp:Transcript_6392/g.11390  ORF Transcript_6392/g.11390 Transcript_6392/m.11390 type:complete len:129 (-) Transcript_6392:1018-1404(-)